LRSKLDFAKSTTSNGVDLFTVDLEVLAEHMTMVDQLFFQSLSVRDFFHQLSKKQASHPIALWISHCNQLSQWFCNAIVAKQGAKSRTSLIDRFLKLGALLWEMGNFSSAITIYLTLSLQSVSLCCKDLDKTAPLGKRFEQLAEKIRPLKNFAGYREALKSHSGPSIPYIAIIMKDIVVLEETSVIRNDDGTNCWSAAQLCAMNDVLESQFLLPKSKKYQFEIDQSIFMEIMSPNTEQSLEDQISSLASSVRGKSTILAEAVLPRAISVRQSRSRPILAFKRNDTISTSRSLFSVDKDSTPLWKNHSCFCLLQLKRAESRDPNWTETISALSSIFSDKSVRHRHRSSGRVTDVKTPAFECISKCVNDLVVVLSLLPQTFAGWSAVELPAEIENRNIVSDTAWSLKALVVETTLAVANTLRSSGANVTDGQISVTPSLLSETDEDSALVNFNIGFFGSAGIDISKVERAVFALLSPESGYNFVMLRGGVKIARSLKISCRIVAQFYLVCPLQRT
jgi:hypothetical protein